MTLKTKAFRHNSTLVKLYYTRALTASSEMARFNSFRCLLMLLTFCLPSIAFSVIDSSQSSSSEIFFSLSLIWDSYCSTCSFNLLISFQFGFVFISSLSNFASVFSKIFSSFSTSFSSVFFFFFHLPTAFAPQRSLATSLMSSSESSS